MESIHRIEEECISSRLESRRRRKEYRRLRRFDRIMDTLTVITYPAVIIYVLVLMPS